MTHYHDMILLLILPHDVNPMKKPKISSARVSVRKYSNIH